MRRTDLLPGLLIAWFLWQALWAPFSLGVLGISLLWWGDVVLIVSSTSRLMVPVLCLLAVIAPSIRGARVLAWIALLPACLGIVLHQWSEFTETGSLWTLWGWWYFPDLLGPLLILLWRANPRSVEAA